MSRHIYQKESILISVDPRSAGVAVSAGVSPISNYIHQAHHLNCPVMQQHPGRVRAARICVNLRHYRFLQSVPAPVFSFGTALALKSGNSSTDGVNVIPAVPFFDFFTTIYAAVIRSVSAYGNSDEKDGLYGQAETFAPRPGFICLKTTAAQLMTDAVSAANSSFSKLRHYLVRFSGVASVFSQMAPTNPGTAATSPSSATTGGTELRLFPLLTLPVSKPTNRQVQQGRQSNAHYCGKVREADPAAGAFGWCYPLRLHFSTTKLTLYEPPRCMWNAAGLRGGFPTGSFPCEFASLRSSLRTEAAPFLRHTTPKTIRHATSRPNSRLF